MYRQCMEQAIAFIGRAKRVHDEMEGYYVPFMDFEAINARREKTLSKILALADEKRNTKPHTPSNRHLAVFLFWHNSCRGRFLNLNSSK
ncbi:MAG: hypothetical protein RQM92_12745 [Candidatus Syntrophopropionicum ammoniitolerans]